MNSSGNSGQLSSKANKCLGEAALRKQAQENSSDAANSRLSNRDKQMFTVRLKKSRGDAASLRESQMQQERVVEIVDSEDTPSHASRSAQGTKAQRGNGVKPNTGANDYSSEKTDRNSEASTVRDVCHDRVRIS